MAVTETEKISWGSRLGDSIKGIITGIVLFLGSFVLLFWNEGRAVATAKMLDEGQGKVVSVESNKTVDSDNEGALVHMVGRADTKDVLTDDVFGVSGTFIRLVREVEIYQWVEHKETKEKKNLGGSVTKTTVYTYSQEWCRDAVDSGSFKESGHDNPAIGKEFPDATWQAENVSFGAFHLSADQIGRIGAEKSWQFPESFTSKVERVFVAGNVIHIPNAETRRNPRNTRDVQAQPRPGDMRVRFRVVTPHDISIVAQQRGETFVSWKAKNGRRLSMLRDGAAEADEMFEAAKSGNSILTWILRLVGFLLMAGGLKSVFAPLSVLSDVLPILGDIVGMGVGLVCNIVAFALSLVTIAIAWIFYRPVLGIILLVIAGAVVFLLWQKRTALKVKKA